MEIYKSRSDKPLIEWQSYEPSLRNITHLTLKLIRKTRGRALDVGCGTGRISFALAKKGFEVTGIDIEERVIEIAKIMAGNSSQSPRFEIMDFCNPKSLQPEFYDLVVCSEVLEHIEDYHPLIENIHATLKPGGRVIITVPYDPRKWSELDEYGGHVRRYTISQVSKDLSQFRNIKILVTGFPFYRILTYSYLAKIRVFKQQHSNETLWENRSTRWIAQFLYPFMRLDNIFAFTRLGDALIVVADKAS
jgi:SAM-dependent methyltransferase